MVFSMAGAINVAGNEIVHHRAEWNVYVDPAAASTVLRSAIPMTIVPLDASDNVPITSFVRGAAQAHHQTAAMRIIATMLRDPYYLQTPVYFWDPLVAVAATDASVLRLRTARLVIDQVPGSDVGLTGITRPGRRSAWPCRPAHRPSKHRFSRDPERWSASCHPVRFRGSPPEREAQRNHVRLPRPGYSGAGNSRSGWLTEPPCPTTASSCSSPSFGRAGGCPMSGRPSATLSRASRPGSALSSASLVRQAPTRPGALTLKPGRYALVCMLEQSSALTALAEVRIR